MSDPEFGDSRSQYEKWPYPEPIRDLPAWLRDNWQWFDPSHSHRVFWPDRHDRADLDVLVAGCGTNQAAVLAYTNPQARVVAVDVSQESLNHQRFLRDGYGLGNLRLHRMALEEAASLDAEFDLVVCTGVLHHLADPVAALAALGQRLRPEGVIGAMVYAKYGRIGVEVLDALFRDLGLAQDHASLRVVKDVIALLPTQHPARSYLQIAGDGQYDAALVDTFLHGRARHYTVADCLDLVDSAGLTFQGWLLNAPYHPHPLVTSSTDFYPTLESLTPRQQWSVMERLNTTNGCHFFMACHPQRSPRSYEVDFSGQACLDYAPSWRMRCGMAGRELYRPDWSLLLNDAGRAFADAVDGRRTIRGIVAEAAQDDSRGIVALEEDARWFFRELWRLDFVAVAIDAAVLG